MLAQEKKLKGFTILEIIVVVVIVGIIAAIGMPNYTSWKKDREVRGAATRIINIFNGISTQLQRNVFPFMQMEVIVSDDQIQFLAKGLTQKKFTQEKLNDSATWNAYLTGVSFNDDICPTSNNDPLNAYWDDSETTDKNEALIFQYISSDIASDLGTGHSAICFSTDGTYYSAAGDFNNSSSIDEVLYICQRAELSQCNDTGGKYHFAITWNRFGNIQLEKWVEGTGWVMQ